MNKDSNTNSATTPAPRTKRWLIGATLAVAAGVAGVSFAQAGPGLPFHHGHGGHMAMSQADVATHVDKLLDQCGANASADQKARVAALAKAAMTDFGTTHQQFAQFHASAHELLMAPVIDRVALEQLRAAQIRQMDEMSRRVLAEMEDAADVLTPAQRATCAGNMRTHNR
jgi:Spy/CpxP family protein refolding chaperone